MRVEPTYIFKEVFSADIIWRRNNKNSIKKKKKKLVISILAWYLCHICNTDWFDQEMNTSIWGSYIAALSGWLRKTLGTSSLDSMCCHSNLNWWQFWNLHKTLYLDATWKVMMQSEQLHPRITTAQIKLVPIHYLQPFRCNMFKK